MQYAAPKQAPIPSGFGPTTTARETLKGIDLTGKIAIVTGGYAGLGLETTRAPQVRNLPGWEAFTARTSMSPRFSA